MARKIIINLLIFCILFISLDFSIALINYNKQVKELTKQAQKHKNAKTDDYHFPEFIYSLRNKHFKEIYNSEVMDTERRVSKQENSSKGSVIVFGCSFAWGCFLEDNQTFEYKLSQTTNRTVYNRGYNGFGLSPMVWLSKNNDFYKTITTPPDYIIYVYILDHTRRIYEEKYGNNFMRMHVGFKAEGNKLVEKYPPLMYLNRFYMTMNYINNFVFKKYLSKAREDANFDLLKLYFEDTRNEIQKRYPDTKFIIIKHPFGLKSLEINPDNQQYYLLYSYTTPRWKELEDEGFIVYDLKQRIRDVDFESDEYTFPDGHPNEKAWNVVVEHMVKDLNL